MALFTWDAWSCIFQWIKGPGLSLVLLQRFFVDKRHWPEFGIITWFLWIKGTGLSLVLLQCFLWIKGTGLS